jgi:CelD/BcsL family acetyltransferase involved in cellulose biosynthesis
VSAKTAEPMLSVDVHKSAEALPLDARALFADAENRNIELGLMWYRLLGEQVMTDDARFLVLRRRERCIAAVAVNAGRNAGALSNYYTALYEPALASDVRAEELVPLIRTLCEQSGAGRFNFAPMDPLAPSFGLLKRAISLAGLVPFEYFRFGNWYLPCRGVGWTEYLASREGALRNTIRRMDRRFAAAGGTLEIIRTSDRVEAGLDAYEAVYAASWKKAEGFPGFVRALVRACADRGWLRLGVARLQGRAIAAQIWIIANGRAEIFKLAYDAAFKEYSAGTVLSARLMQGALDEPDLAEVDYLIGDDAYKKAWMTHRRERWGIVGFDPRNMSGLWGLGREVVGRVIKPRSSATVTAMP